MNVKKWHIPLIPIIVTLTLISSIAPPVPSQRQVTSVHAAAPPPPRELDIEHFSAGEADQAASPRQGPGLFPYYNVRIEATWGGNNLLPEDGQDRNLYFTTVIVYPAPEEGVEYTGDLTWSSAYVESCTHDEAQHSITCTGHFPPSDPVQWLETWASFRIQGTCDLYPDPPDQVTIEATVTWSDSSTTEVSDNIPVEQPLDLTVIPDAPADDATNVFIESNHQGPLFQWHDQTAGYTCGDGSDPINQDILYSVTIQKQGGQEQRVGDENGECTRQIQLSEDDLSCLESGDPANWQWTVTAVDIKYSPCVPPLLFQDNEFGFATASCKPEVSTIAPQYGNQYFLQNVSVPNRYRVEVDWNGDAYRSPAESPYGKVHFEINGTENPASGVDGQQWGVEHPLNMGSDFQASLTGGDNDLKVWATYRPSWAAADLNSEETHVQPMVYPLPEWITELSVGNFNINLQEATVSYGRGLQYPDPAFQAQYQVPSMVPYLGGANVGIVDTAAEVDFEVSSDGTGEVGLGGRTGVQVTEQNQVRGSIEGRGQVKLGNPEGLDLTGATFGLNVNGEIAKEMGVADLVPAIKAAEKWWIVGHIVKWFNRRATVKAALGPEIDIETNFRDVNDELEFESGTGTGLIDMTLTLTLKVLESLKASVFGGAKPEVTIQVPASGPYGYLKNIGIGFRAGVNLVVWIFDKTWERGVTCGLPGGCRTDSGEGQLLAALNAAPTWGLIKRDYLGPGYAAFVANQRPRRSSNQLTSEMAISQNVFPLSNPALAVRDDGLQMMLWGYDDPAQPITQSLEIHASYLSGGTWISDTVTDDNLLDFSPQVAFDAEGDAVAVWERVNTVHISPTLGITFAKSLEIASAQWLSDTQSWTNVVTLTQESQGLMDTSPQLARGQTDGTLLAAWRTSDGYDILGTITHPLTITYALWDGDNWSAPAAALSNLTSTIGVNVAVYSATQAALVLAQDTDGDEITQSDNELFYATWDGASWSGLTRLTNDTITDTAPVLNYDDQGTITLAWLRGDDLVMHTGWPTAPITYRASAARGPDAPNNNLTVVRPNSTSGAFLDYQLQRDPDGNLILLWQEIGTEGADVAYTVYDAANDSWGADNALTSDGLLEEALAPAFDGQGDLYMAYNKVTMDWVTTTRVVEISPTLTVTVTEYMPEPVQSDIFQLVHTLGHDLGIADADIVLSDPNPAPGGHVTISATIHNLGDLAITGTQVIFYDGDPDTGGIQIGTPQALASPFRAATTDTVSVEWDVPASANSHLIYVVVDPADAITETNEANNQAVLGVVQPDLTVAWAYSLHTADTLTLTATISNVGTLAATGPFSVAFRAGDAVTGTLLGTASMGSDLAAGDRISVGLALGDPAALAGTGDRFWAVADAGEAVTEVNEANNTHYAALNVLPDLTLATTDIQFGDAVTVTVHNIGVLTATDTMLAVWQGSLNGPTVYSDTLGDLEPGGSGTANFTVSQGGSELWVKADPDDAVAESDESNNLAVRVQCPQPLISVGIDGPTSGTTNTLYAFTATIVPTDATGPISYTWTPTPNPGSLLLPDRSVVTYTWDSLGTYVITLTAESCSGSKVATHTITIQAPRHAIYLPLVLKNYEPPPTPDRYVKRYGSYEGDCSTPETACGSIQYAVDQASPGDLVGIAGYEDAYTPENPDGMATRTYWAVESHASPSGYNGPDEISQVVYVDKSVTLYGGYNADFDDWDPATYKTVLRPGLTGLDARVVFIDPNAAATLEWLYIIEGNAYGQGGLYNPPYEDAGNGILAWGDYSDTAAGVTIRNCVIANNTGNAYGGGGGMYIKGRESVTIANNTVQGNQAFRGGGINIDGGNNIIVSDNEVVENYAYGQQAGGIHLVDTYGARLTGNHVYSNTASASGGGIEARFSYNVYLIGNTIHDNVASQYKYGIGGGVDLFAIGEGYTVQDNVIYNNTATVYTGQGDYDTGIGGGIYLNDTVGGVVVGNVITGNVGSQYFRGTGGGLSIFMSEDLLVERNFIQGNVATAISNTETLNGGGGVRISSDSTNVILSNNVIVGNQSLAGGGGMFLTGSGGSPVEVTFLHNTVADNGAASSNVQQAGYDLLPGAASTPPVGPQFAELRTLAESAVSAQHRPGAAVQVEAQGILVDAYSTLNGVNNLLSGHTLGISVTYPASNMITMDHTLWHDNVTDYSSGVAHTNDRSGDPAFVNPAAWDYHIGSGSAAIDQGTNAGITSDWDGDTRPQGGGYDIGADEYTGTLAQERRRYNILSLLKHHIP